MKLAESLNQSPTGLKVIRSLGKKANNDSAVNSILLCLFLLKYHFNHTSQADKWQAILNNGKDSKFGQLIETEVSKLFPPGILEFDLTNLPEISEPTLATYLDVISNLETSAWNLGYLYERLACSKRSKPEGIFYTPLAQVRSMLDNVLPWLMELSEKNPRPLRILDPACGCGIFLSELAKLVSFPAVSFGIDRDPTASALTHFVLTHQPTSLFSHQILNADFLLGSTELDRLESTPLDCIIGNPPYGLARGNGLTKHENSLLKDRFALYREGKVNKYILFMAKSYELLAPGGILSFIVPNAWLGIRGGRAIRRKWLAENALKQIFMFDFQVFEEPSVEAVVFLAQKPGAGRAPRSEIQVFECSKSSAKLCLELPVETCLKQPDQKIPLRWRPELDGFFKKIESSSYRLGDETSPFRAFIALQAYAEGKGNPPQTALDVKMHVFDRTQAKDPNDLPYLHGRDISRFNINWSGDYLHYGPWLAEPQTLARFKGPRVIVREILNSKPNLISAAYVDDIFLYNKSVLHILPKEGESEKLMRALCAFLNSTLVSFILSYCGRKSQRRLFPKIVNDDLKDLPISKDFIAYVPELAQLAAQRSFLDSTNPECGVIENRINQACWSMYGEKELTY